ncbi:Ig-like domain-containing protein [Primorskyibacter sp. S187A]|uniref:Ig-like domain-containing protein n=1 Tax=Primorskyibacter sp. S187A TaxID=3415130 RepID=UPI003C7B7960
MPQSLTQYFFGNSLVNFAGGTANANVPHWLNQFIEADGGSYAVNGGYAFLRQAADNDVPRNEWGFSGVDGVWDQDLEGFDEVSFDSVVITPANFIQDREPTQNYPGDDRSPLDAILDVIEQVQTEQGAAKIYMYQGWSDIGFIAPDFPPTEQELETYYAYASGPYSDWYDTFLAEIDAAAPDADVTLIPINDVLIELISDGPLSDLEATDLFVDSAPHGTETTYFLASMITYSALFGEPVQAFGDVPDTIHPAVADNLPSLAALIDTRVAELMGEGGTDDDEGGGDDGGDDEPPIEPENSAPNARDDTAGTIQNEPALIDVLANDTDPDGDPLTLTNVIYSSNAYARIIDNQIEYYPNGDFFGEDTLTYEVSDDEGAISTASVLISVEPIDEAPEPENTAPNALDDVGDTDAGTSVLLDVLANDSDPDGDPLTLQSVDQPLNGSVQIVDNQIEYTPAQGFVGTDTFDYIVSDGQGGESAASVSVVVSGDVQDDNGGFSALFYELDFDVESLDQVDFGAPVDAQEDVASVRHFEQTGPGWEGGHTDHFAARYIALLDVEEAGLYTFELIADDEAALRLNGEELVGAGPKSDEVPEYGQVELQPGPYLIELDYLEIDGAQTLSLRWSGPDTDDTFVPVTPDVPGADLSDLLALAESDLDITEPLILSEEPEAPAGDAFEMEMFRFLQDDTSYRSKLEDDAKWFEDEDAPAEEEIGLI